MTLGLGRSGAGRKKHRRFASATQGRCALRAPRGAATAAAAGTAQAVPPPEHAQKRSRSPESLTLRGTHNFPLHRVQHELRGGSDDPHPSAETCCADPRRVVTNCASLVRFYQSFGAAQYGLSCAGATAARHHVPGFLKLRPHRRLPKASSRCASNSFHAAETRSACGERIL